MSWKALEIVVNMVGWVKALVHIYNYIVIISCWNVNFNRKWRVAYLTFDWWKLPDYKIWESLNHHFCLYLSAGLELELENRPLDLALYTKRKYRIQLFYSTNRDVSLSKFFSRISWQSSRIWITSLEIVKCTCNVFANTFN